MLISLPQQVEDRLRAEASRRGSSPEGLASQLLDESLPKSVAEQSNLQMLELLDRWEEEDRTDDPNEIARRQQEFEEFKQAINASRPPNRPVYRPDE